MCFNQNVLANYDLADTQEPWRGTAAFTEPNAVPRKLPARCVWLTGRVLQQAYTRLRHILLVVIRSDKSRLVIFEDSGFVCDLALGHNLVPKRR